MHWTAKHLESSQPASFYMGLSAWWGGIALRYCVPGYQRASSRKKMQTFCSLPAVWIPTCVPHNGTSPPHILAPIFVVLVLVVAKGMLCPRHLNKLVPKKFQLLQLVLALTFFLTHCLTVTFFFTPTHALDVQSADQERCAKYETIGIMLPSTTKQ